MKNYVFALLSLCITFFYLLNSLLPSKNLVLSSLLTFFACFISPGFITSLLVSNNTRRQSLIRYIVESFFLSSLFLTLISLLNILLYFSITPLLFVIQITFINLTLLLILALSKKAYVSVVKISKIDIAIFLLGINGFVFLINLFTNLPRFFTPDETLYIYSARVLILNQMITIISKPTLSFFQLIFWGKCLWYLLLTVFVVSMHLPTSNAFLLEIFFFVPLIFTPSLFFNKNENLELCASICILITFPLLISFSGTALNDVAIAFYVVLSIAYFYNAFNKKGDCIVFNVKELIKSALVVIFLSLIKPNIFFISSFWLVLVYLFLYQKKVCYQSILKYIKISVYFPLLYELFIDLPYSISTWVLQDKNISSFFSNYIIISPISIFLRIFFPPPNDISARTFLSLKIIDYCDKFYRLITPEVNSIIISTTILIAPFLFPILMQYLDNTQKVKYSILFFINTYSFWFFYLLTYNMFGDIERYSLWIYPLWVILSVKLLKLTIEKIQFKIISLFGISGILLHFLNIYLVSNKGGVYVGYLPETRIYTIYFVDSFFILFIAFLTTIYLIKKFNLNKQGRELFHSKPKILKFLGNVSVKRFFFILIIFLILVNNLYYSNLLVSNNKLYKNHNFHKISSTLNEIVGNSTPLVFANNYIYMRNFVSNNFLKEGTFLPLPVNNNSLTQIINSAPNGTLFLVSGDLDTSWYSYNDRYITKYSEADVLTPETLSVQKLPNITLPNRVLYLPFESTDNSIIYDNSTFRNNGTNYGVSVTSGYYGKGLYFNGSTYISFGNTTLYNFDKSLTISFYALIEKAEPRKGYMILSKGNGYFNGSFSIFVYNTYIYFDLGDIGRLYFSAIPYVGKWHHYVFIYNGEKIMAFIDGVLTGVTYGHGSIRKTNYPLELGRDSERGNYFFIGKLDELQVSPIAINATTIARTYFVSYAVRIRHLSIPTGNCTFFKLVHKFKPTQYISSSNVLYIKPSLSLLSNSSVLLSIKLNLQGSNDTITILAVNQKGTKVFVSSIFKGLNYLSYAFSPEKNWASFWYYSRIIRLIVIFHNTVIFNQVIYLSDYTPVYLAILIITLLIISCYLFLLNTSFATLLYEKFVTWIKKL